MFSYLPLFLYCLSVCDEHKEFKDVKLFYRFRKDDGTFPLDNEVKAFMRGQRLYEKYVARELPRCVLVERDRAISVFYRFDFSLALTCGVVT